MNNIYLETPRLLLVEMTKDHARDLLDLDSDPDVVRYLTDGKPSTETQVHEAVERIMFYITKYEHKFGLWPTYEKSSQEFIGWFLLRPAKNDPDNLKDIEIGYRLKKKFWGKGYATEASKLLMERAFAQLNADKVFATTMLKNKSSSHVMEKLGMTFHSHYTEMEFPGQDKSAVRYEITKAQWQHNNSKYFL